LFTSSKYLISLTQIDTERIFDLQEEAFANKESIRERIVLVCSNAVESVASYY